jgi:hypothetical protein
MTRNKESYNGMYIVVLLWIRDAESIVVTTLGWELVYILCCIPYPGPLPGRRKFPCYNFRNIPDFLIRFELVSGIPCVGVVCSSKVFLPLCCERPQVLHGNELGAVVNVLRVHQVNLLNT